MLIEHSPRQLQVCNVFEIIQRTVLRVYFQHHQDCRSKPGEGLPLLISVVLLFAWLGGTAVESIEGDKEQAD